MTDDLFDEPQKDDVPRDRWGRYLIPDPTQPGMPTKSWTRATTFAKSMMDTYVLNMWQQRMAMKGLAMRPDLLALVAATSLDDRDTLNKVAEDAKQHAGAKDRANLGTAMHSFTESYDRSCDTFDETQVPETLRPDMSAYVTLVRDLDIEFVEIERIVIVPEFGVAGTFDRLGLLRKPLTLTVPWQDVPITLGKDTHVMVDLKTGRDLTYGWNEIVIQLALYANAFAMWRLNTSKFDRMPCLNKKVALVIWLPVGEAKATVFAVNIAAGWEAAKLCQGVRDWRRTKNLAVPVEVVNTAVPDDAEMELDRRTPYCHRCDTDTHLCPGCGEPVPHGTVACSNCDDPAEQQLKAVETVCGAVMDGTDVVCTVPAGTLHGQHAGSGYTWLAEGQQCIECHRPAKNGRITHQRGCSQGPRPGRKPKQYTCAGCGQPAGTHAPNCPETPPVPDLPVQEAPVRTMTPEVLTEAVTSAMIQDLPGEVRPPTWAERIEQASSTVELSAVYRDASAVGEWTPALMKLATLQRSKFKTL